MAYSFNDGAAACLPAHAIVLAAGFGKRMMPLTETTPKPLLPLGHHVIIDYTLDRLEEAGVRNIVVNVHYKADMMADYLAKRTKPIKIVREEEILETGGACKAALPLLGGGRFFVANADTVWLDGLVPTIESLNLLWHDSDMDALLLTVKTPVGETGDYDINSNTDKLTWRADGTGQCIYAGLAIVHPRLFKDAPEGAFSLKVLFDQAQNRGRLFGARHAGKWFHLGTPAALAATDAEFRAMNL